MSETTTKTQEDESEAYAKRFNEFAKRFNESEDESEAYAKRFNEFAKRFNESEDESELAADGGLAMEGTNPITKI